MGRGGEEMIGERFGVTVPLEEVRWVSDDADLPADDAPILAPYASTDPGYELLVSGACESVSDRGCFEDGGEGYVRFGLRDTGKRGADRAGLDEEVRLIDEMQRDLGVLSDDARYTRIQIACLTRCYFTFPANVDLVLDGIGRGKVNLDARVSCRSPWNDCILPLLRHRRRHPAEGTNVIDSRRALIRAYLTILNCWAAEGDLEYLKWQLLNYVDLGETTYRRLGTPTKLKLLYVRKLCWMLSYWAFESLHRPGRQERHDDVASLYRGSILQELKGEEDAIGQMVDRSRESGSCHHAFFRHIDHQIAAIGAGRAVRLPGAGKERRRIHIAVTNYVHALGSWLAGRRAEEAEAIWPAGGDTVRRVYELVGEGRPQKRWLVACLWKKLREHHAALGRGALDESPELFAIPIGALAV